MGKKKRRRVKVNISPDPDAVVQRPQPTLVETVINWCAAIGAAYSYAIGVPALKGTFEDF
jgi:hypothetical protein